MILPSSMGTPRKSLRFLVVKQAFDPNFNMVVLIRIRSEFKANQHLQRFHFRKDYGAIPLKGIYINEEFMLSDDQKKTLKAHSHTVDPLSPSPVLKGIRLTM